MSYKVISGERELSVEQLRHNATRLASALKAQGVGEDDAVAIMLRNDIAFLETNVACAMIGAYAVPVNWHFKGEEARYVLEDSAAKVAIAHSDLLAQIGADAVPGDVAVRVVATPPEIAAAYGLADESGTMPAGALEYEAWRDAHAPLSDEPPASRGSMIYTSGTTGRPKGVRRRPSDEAGQARSMMIAVRGFGIREGMVAAMTGPMYHSAPNAYANSVLRIGGDLVLLPRFEPEALLAAIERHRISHMHVVPTMFVRLLALPEAVRAKYDLSSLEFIIHGAAPCPIETKLQMVEWWGPVIYEYYGSTEAGLVTLCTSQEYQDRPGTVGRPHDGTEVRIYADDDSILVAGEIGEIYMSLNALSDFTYHNQHDKRVEIARGDFVTNGDVGYLDDEGYLYLCDRKRDMIISGGVNIYPAEIEGTLINMDGVRDCAVFGIPHEEFGESVAAAVEPEDGASLQADDVRQYLSAHLANFKVPRVVEFHSQLPREDTGKIFKRLLRDPYWEKAGRKI